MTSCCSKFIFLIGIFALVPTWAAGTPSGGPRFGPEFTFSHFPSDPEQPPVHHIHGRARLVRKMQEHLVEGQLGGAKFKVYTVTLPARRYGRAGTTDPYFEAYRFDSPNGWWVELSLDPGVVEVTMPPMLLEQYEQYADDVQDALFVSAANVELYPALFTGGGHISIGIDYFRSNPLLFRNFLVDLLNHNELSLGVLNYDTHNALPAELHSEYAVKNMREAIELFDNSPQDEGAMNRLISRYTMAHKQSMDDYSGIWNQNGAIGQLARLEEALAIEPYPARQLAYRHQIQRVQNAIDNPSKFLRGKLTAINLIHAAGSVSDRPERQQKRRMELRSVRAQASMDVWVRQIRLLKKRIDFLATLNHPIEYKPRHDLSELRGSSIEIKKENLLNPPVDPQEALQNFYEYVTEAGEDWADHQDYLWPQWISSGELESFNQSLCSELLGVGAS